MCLINNSQNYVSHFYAKCNGVHSQFNNVHAVEGSSILKSLKTIYHVNKYMSCKQMHIITFLPRVFSLWMLKRVRHQTYDLILMQSIVE